MLERIERISTQLAIVGIIAEVASLVIQIAQYVNPPQVQCLLIVQTEVNPSKAKAIALPLFGASRGCDRITYQVPALNKRDRPCHLVPVFSMLLDS